MIQRILVGTPTSNESPAALEAAAELASSYDAELVVLRVEPEIDARQMFDPDGVPDPTDHVIPLRRRYPGLRVRSHNARGNAVRNVCQVAEDEGSDLIVVPQGRRAGADALFSRRASRVLAERAPCPVLLVAS